MSAPPSESLPLAAPDTAAPSETPRVHLLGMSRAELVEWAIGIGLEKYRAAQIGDWIFEKGADSFEQMSNLPKAARTELAALADIYRSQITRVSASQDGTQKLLLTWPDGCAVETVWIPGEGRNTACLSSQVGCPVGCRFCASGLNGVQRDLTAGEIVEQAMRVRRLIADAVKAAGPEAGIHERLSNIVMMGMGEPLANYDNVIRAIRLLNSADGLNIGARKITVSTVGLPKQIRRLAEEDLQLNLALSLHAPDQKLRHELIPWGKVPIDELLSACSYYFERTGREITLEYVLLAGVNDLPQHADQLAGIARRLRCNINLLRYNPVPGLPYERPSAEAAHEFQRRLRARGVNAHIRTSRGKDINAACGQLRRAAAAEQAG